MNGDIKNIQKDEIEQAAKTLHLAFINDPLMLWIFGSNEIYQQKSLAVTKTWVSYCVRYGLALRSANFECVALRKLKGDVKNSLWRLFRAGMLKTPKLMGNNAFSRLMAFETLSNQFKHKHMANKPFLYCWMLGTKPNFQQLGFAKLLMEKTFEISKKESIPCYLEVASPHSKAIHEHKGYRILDEFMLPQSNIKITTMLKTP
jgi:Acetyltransferase (GNAT) family